MPSERKYGALIGNAIRSLIGNAIRGHSGHAPRGQRARALVSSKVILLELERERAPLKPLGHHLLLEQAG